MPAAAAAHAHGEDEAARMAGHRSVSKRVCLWELWSQICEQASVFVGVVVTDL